MEFMGLQRGSLHLLYGVYIGIWQFTANKSLTGVNLENEVIKTRPLPVAELITLLNIFLKKRKNIQRK